MLSNTSFCCIQGKQRTWKEWAAALFGLDVPDVDGAHDRLGDWLEHVFEANKLGVFTRPNYNGESKHSRQCELLSPAQIAELLCK